MPELRVLGAVWSMEDASPGEPGLSYGSAGEATYPAHSIRVDRDMHEDRKAEVRFHELLHVADKTGCGDSPLTEDQTDRVARALWCILRDNPHVLPLLGLADKPHKVR